MRTWNSRAGSCASAAFSSGPAPSWNGKTPAQWQTNELDDVCTILICHCPEVLDTSLELYQFDLVLSGHAHGGQVRIGSQGLWSTSQGFLPKYTSGVNQMGESQVVISRGLGDSEPFPRIFNQPELVVVDVN